MTWNDKKEDQFQAAAKWLKVVGRELHDVMYSRNLDGDFVIMNGDEIAEVEEKRERFFDDLKLESIGHDFESDSTIYRVYLPAKYQGIL